jgi:hypothetical protein
MPPTISAAQHIFASVTSEQSPARRRGYQTLVYTHDRLTTADIRALEDRAQYRVQQDEKDKWQFFWLPSRQAVISHLVPVPERDEFGRKGRYLAHSLIVSVSDWQLLGCNPFGLMNAANFCRTMSQALAAGNLKTGELSAAPLDISHARHERARELAALWAPEELWKLARLACHPQAITDGRQFVAFVGDDREIKDALDVAFLLPPPMRSGCSFDTFASGCSWPAGVIFWGQGFANEREARTPFVVDATSRKVRMPPDWHPPRTPHEQWLKFKIIAKQFSSLQTDQGGIQLLSAVLEGRSAGMDELSGIAASLKRDFAEANREQIVDRIASLVPEHLPGYLLDKIVGQIGRTTHAQLDWLIRNPGGEVVGDMLFDLLRDWREAPAPDLMRSILPLSVRHPGLNLMMAVWAGDEKEIYRRSSAMTPEQYQLYVPGMRSRSASEPWHFFSARHLAAWFKIFNSVMQLVDVSLGISLVVRHGSEQDLDQLSAVAELLASSEGRKSLLKGLEKEPFRRRVKSLRSALEQSLCPKSESTTESPASTRGWSVRRSERR